MASREDLQARERELHDDVLARRFVAKASTGDAALVTPEDVLGHRVVVVARLLYEGTDDSLTRAADGYTNDDRWASLESLSILALGAVPHLWSQVAWRKLWDLTIPRHVISPRALPLPYTWHVFTFTPGTDGGFIVAILIVDSQIGISVTEFAYEENKLVVTPLLVPYGKTWPDDFEDADERIGETLQLLAFLSSPFIPRSRERMSRGSRREIARKGSEADADDEVTFVLLRRLGLRRDATPETEVEVAWKHRWLVSGHLRAQWYPSERAHHLIWIAPYMKGPEDAPFLGHVYKVAR